MKIKFLPAVAFLLAGLAAAITVPARAARYAVETVDRVGGDGPFDYVYADAAGRRLYIPRGDRVTVFDLDSLKAEGKIPGTNEVHGVAVDPASHHGFSSSQPVVMWDTRTLATIKTIPVVGEPDGILFDPGTERIFILSHTAPNATVIDARDGSVVGTIADLGGAPEQGASDGKGRVYFAIEDQSLIAVVDPRTLAVTGHYGLGGRGAMPSGLAIDAKNGVLFACCRNPHNAVVLNADDGSILASLPIGIGVDAALFNPATGEAFSSQRDGTLTVIREESPSRFEVEQIVRTRYGAKTSTLDSATGRIILITADRLPPPPDQPAGHRPIVPGSFTIIVVGRAAGSP